MRGRRTAFCVLMLLALPLAGGCSKADAPRPEAAPSTPAAGGSVAEGKVLFGLKCGICHDIARAADRKETRENWAGIVKDMQEKRPGWINDEEAAKILDFLVDEHGK